MSMKLCVSNSNDKNYAESTQFVALMNTQIEFMKPKYMVENFIKFQTVRGEVIVPCYMRTRVSDL